MFNGAHNPIFSHFSNYNGGGRSAPTPIFVVRGFFSRCHYLIRFSILLGSLFVFQGNFYILLYSDFFPLNFNLQSLMFLHYRVGCTIYSTESLRFGFDNGFFCIDSYTIYINYMGIVNNKKSAFYKL